MTEVDGVELHFSEASVLSPAQALSSPPIWILETFFPKNLNIMLCLGFCFQVIKLNSNSTHRESKVCQQSLVMVLILPHESLEQTVTSEKYPLG